MAQIFLTIVVPQGLEEFSKRDNNYFSQLVQYVEHLNSAALSSSPKVSLHASTSESQPFIEILFIAKNKYLTRAERLHVGIKNSSGRFVFLHHPRNVLDFSAWNNLLEWLQRNPQFEWGGLTHSFDNDHWWLRWTSWYSNQVRARLKSIFYLDHCFILKKSLYTEDLPFVPIFEDTLLSKQLKKKSRGQLLPFKTTTSSVRFQKNGFFKQSLLNQLLKLGFWLGFSPERLNSIYEKNLNLN